MRLVMTQFLKKPKVLRFLCFCSSVVGLVFYALSSSLNHLLGKWTWWKILLYTLFSVIISLCVLLGTTWQRSTVLRWKAHMAFLVLVITSLYSFFLDKMQGKPDAYNFVSYAAFAVMSLGLSRQTHCGIELDLFYFFSGTLIVQLLMNKLWLVVVAVVLIDYSLIALRSSLNASSESGNLDPHVQDQVVIPVDSASEDTTPDGQTALAICQRLTRQNDYHEETVRGQESNKDRLCVDVLEREMRRNPTCVNMSVSSQLSADDLNMRLDYLENRVAIARLLFPAEARVAFEVAEADSSLLYANSLASRGSNGSLKEVDLNENAEADSSSLYANSLASRGSNGSLKEVDLNENAEADSSSLYANSLASRGSNGSLKEVDLNENAEADSSSLYANSLASRGSNGSLKEVYLNETPSVRTRKLQQRLHSLMKTVDNGRRFFPHCSEVLDKFLEDDISDIFSLEKGSEEEEMKKARFMELKYDIQKAFRMEALNHKVKKK
ncbi:hypothetical protein RJT34_11004 [Clitoria ternatea]|uniref:NPR1/NIM1-like C-terminal domain-containing protein n=1 Tax=Clitoria ternatea TaxID=43366 RepID=A0AAN9PK41_CLITE